MKKLTNKELIDEIFERDLIDEVLAEVDNDTLVDMVRDRDLEECFDPASDFNPDEERERIEEETDKYYKADNRILSKDFDRFQLRDHLVSIAGLQSHCSDKKLFDKLADLLEFS